MNVRRVPAMFALVFAASACTPSLVMLEYAPQAPVTAYDVGLDVSTGGDEPFVQPEVGTIYAASTGGPDEASVISGVAPPNVDSAGAQLSSTAVGARSEQSVTP